MTTVKPLSEQKDTLQKLDGIKGWLSFLSLSVIITPLQATLSLYVTILPISSPNSLAQKLFYQFFLNLSGKSDIPQSYYEYAEILQSMLQFSSVKIITGIAIIDCMIILALSINCCKLLFQKKYSFPKFYIFGAAFSLIGSSILAILLFICGHFFIKSDVSLAECFKSAGIGLWNILWIFFWILYLCKSKRVKATFRR